MSSYNYNAFLKRSGILSKEGDPSLVEVVSTVVPPLSPSGPWLGGGSLRRTILETDPGAADFDFFFASESQLADFERGLVERGAVKTTETKHHVTYTMTIDKLERKIQCIRFKFYKDVNEMLDSFDFTICQFAYDGTMLYVGEHTLWDAARNRLALHRLTFPVSTMRRLIKYSKQGFYACEGCLQKILSDTIANPELQTQLDVEYVD